MSTQIPAHRRQKIIEILEKKDYAEISYLSQLFSVSEMTIRRDLEKLESDGQVIRVYGGAKLKEKRGYEASIEERLSIQNEEKKLIAMEAAKYIEDGDVVAFDASTSALEVSKAIKLTKKITVVTNNIPIAMELSDAPHIAVILLGGFLRGKSLSLIGGSLQKYLESIYIDKAFISSKAISFKEGLTDATIDEGEAKQAMINKSNHVIVLADHSKLGKLAFYKVCPAERIDRIITDQLKPWTEEQKHCIAEFKESGTDVVVVSGLKAK